MADEKAFNLNTNTSVVNLPDAEERILPLHPVILRMATAGDAIPAWGLYPRARDRHLRDFWPYESWLAGTVYGVSIRNASFAWEIVGTDPTKPNPKNTINAVTKMLKLSNQGSGWQDLITKTCIDLYTTDNGAIWEKVRRNPKDPSSPVVNLVHLDSGRCLRTGDPDTPIIYTDRRGNEHLMRWWQVEMFTEMPSPMEDMYGMQYCAVTRCLTTAQVLRDIAIYKREKVSGQFTRSIHIVSGVTRSNITDAQEMAVEEALNVGLTRYSQPVIIPGIDPTATLSHIQIDLATLPDGFDEETTYKWYVAQLALNFGVDYQEIAPLMVGSIGSSNQSDILHMKTRGKGPAVVMAMIENAMNDHGIMPSNVRFRFKEHQDLQAESQKAEARFTRSKARSQMLLSGEIDAEASRKLAILDGDIPAWIAEEANERMKNQPPPLTNQVPGARQVQGGIDSHRDRIESVEGKDFATFEDYVRLRRSL